MSRAQRGGQTLKTGKVGRCNILRQQFMMPGETINARLKGQVRLETLRQRESLNINAHLGVFIQPVRWHVSGWDNIIKAGPETFALPATTLNETDWAKLGIGAGNGATGARYMDFYEDCPLQIYNSWYKWPEIADTTSWPEHGPPAVPLSAVWSRGRLNTDADQTAEHEIDVSGSVMDVRDLAQKQAQFTSAIKRDVTSFGRSMEIHKQLWGADGSREIEKVPMMVDQVEVGVNPRDMPATDGPSLGTWQSMFDFNVDHTIRGITAPEHCVLTYILTVRFAPVIEMCMPLATDQVDWYELMGDPDVLASAAPVPAEIREFIQGTSTTTIGNLPKGWQWRCGHDVIGKTVGLLDNFPLMEQPTDFATSKDATRRKDAFWGVEKDDYVAEIYFTEDSIQPIGDSRDSYFSGMADDMQKGIGGHNDEFPYGGKNL